MAFFVTPVIYPLRYVPARYQLWMGLNPMAGIVEGFRYSILGGNINWSVVALSLATTCVLFVFGLFVFRRMERRFADVI